MSKDKLFSISCSVSKSAEGSFFIRNFYGMAGDYEEAVRLAKEAAKEEGMNIIEINSMINLGKLSF